MSVLLQIDSSVGSAAVCSQAGLLILHFELGRPAHSVTGTSGHRLHHVELRLQKTECKVQEYVCSVGLSRERRKEELTHEQAALFPKLSIREKASLFPLGVLRWATKGSRVFLLSRFVHDEIETRKNRKGFPSTSTQPLVLQPSDQNDQ